MKVLSRFAYLICFTSISVLAACSSSPELSSTTVEMEAEDTFALEQYKPDAKFVREKDLSSAEQESARLDKGLKVGKTFTFSDGSKQDYATVGNWVVEADMLIAPIDEFVENLKKRDKSITAGEDTLTAQGAFYYNTSRWTNSTIYYSAISIKNNFESFQRDIIYASMRHITEETNVRFLPDNGGNRVVFTNVNKDGCYSALGMRGGAQILNLGDSCVGISTVVHELGHAAGFMHEHSRTTRDSYITVKNDNLTALGKSNFSKQNAFTWTTYDYLSIMHYPRTTRDTRFVLNPDKPMFTTFNYTGTVRSSRLSRRDIEVYDAMYQ